MEKRLESLSEVRAIWGKRNLRWSAPLGCLPGVQPVEIGEPLVAEFWEIFFFFAVKPRPSHTLRWNRMSSCQLVLILLLLGRTRAPIAFCVHLFVCLCWHPKCSFVCLTARLCITLLLFWKHLWKYCECHSRIKQLDHILRSPLALKPKPWLFRSERLHVLCSDGNAFNNE